MYSGASHGAPLLDLRFHEHDFVLASIYDVVFNSRAPEIRMAFLHLDYDPAFERLDQVLRSGSIHDYVVELVLVPAGLRARRESPLGYANAIIVFDRGTGGFGPSVHWRARWDVV